MPYSTKGQIVDTTNSAGRTIKEMWNALFYRNEVLWYHHDFSDILIDTEIINAMKVAFPGRKRTRNQLIQARQLYLQGGGYSFRYVIEDGYICRATTRGRVVSKGGKSSPKLRSKNALRKLILNMEYYNG